MSAFTHNCDLFCEMYIQNVLRIYIMTIIYAKYWYYA